MLEDEIFLTPSMYSQPPFGQPMYGQPPYGPPMHTQMATHSNTVVMPLGTVKSILSTGVHQQNRPHAVGALDCCGDQQLHSLQPYGYSCPATQLHSSPATQPHSSVWFAGLLGDLWKLWDPDFWGATHIKPIWQPKKWWMAASMVMQVQHFLRSLFTPKEKILSEIQRASQCRLTSRLLRIVWLREQTV